MASELVNVVRAFTLSIVRDGQLVKQKIEAGIQRLEDDIASHWYTKAHATDVPEGVKQSDAEAADADSKAAEAEAAKASAKAVAK